MRIIRRPKSKVVKRQKAVPVTFFEHISELQGRLFAVAVVFLLIAGAAFPFFDQIVSALLAPLSREQELVYLTPGGAFTFVMQVCLYVGLIGSLPVIIYHLYCFIMPAVQRVVFRRAVGYTAASFLLAITGIIFAYIVSLPAALHFLTGFDLYHINPMLTIDSYLSFVMTYLLTGALLFQLPLIMIIINTVTPLKPSRLMEHQPKMTLGSFIVAALISPTPDAINQTLLAAPVIVMYQFGIIIVAAQNRKRKKASATVLSAQSRAQYIVEADEIFDKQPVLSAGPVHAVGQSTKHQRASPVQIHYRSMDGIIVPSRSTPAAVLSSRRHEMPVSLQPRPTQPPR